MQVWHRYLIPPLSAAPLRLQLRVVLRKGAEVLQAARRLLQRTAAAPAAGRLALPAMAHITSVRLQGFKSVSQLDVRFGRGLNVIVGKPAGMLPSLSNPRISPCCLRHPLRPV